MKFLHWLFLFYFVTHIPITILFDMQPLLHGTYLNYPKALLQMNADFIRDFEDPFLGKPPLYFVCFTYCEIFLQLPFFFIAIWALLRGSNWIRIPMIIYGTHVATTCIPLLATFWMDNPGRPTKYINRVILSVIYGFYFLVPFLMVIDFGFHSRPFDDGRSSSSKTAVDTQSSGKQKRV